MSPKDEVPWTPGEWRAAVDDINGAVHEEEMREFDADYKASHQYWSIHAWRNGMGLYVAETGCHELSEVNAKLIAESPTMAALLEAAVTSMQDSGYANDHLIVREIRACLARIGRGK